MFNNREKKLKTTIIYSNPQDDEVLRQLTDDAETRLLDKGLLGSRFNLGDIGLGYCTGCWSCWWKTPGECALKDGISEIYRTVMDSGLILFVSPLNMGAVTSELKTFIERMVPLVHPYTIMVDGEVHHRKRYDLYPDMAAVLGAENDTDDDDRKINEGYFNRLIKNFHSSLRFVEFSDTLDPEGVIHELLTD